MAFEPKFDLLPQDLKDKIFFEVGLVGEYKAAEKYFEEAGMSQKGLYLRLKKQFRKKEPNGESEKKDEGSNYTKPGGKKPWRFMEAEPEKLSKSEKDLLKRLGEGTVTIDEASKVIAVKVFEKMLKYPFLLSYTDFIKTELLKVKKEETAIKESWAKGLLVHLLRGKLPPTHCPKCGHNISKDYILEGEILTQ